MSTFLVPTPGGNPAGVQANQDGTVWVSEYYANALALLIPSIAPHTDAVVAPTSGLASNRVASSPRTASLRSIGVTTNEAGSSAFVRPSFTQGWIEYPFATANVNAEDMRIDRIGRVYFEGDNGLLGVLNPYIANYTEYAVPSINSGYYNVALDPEQDKLWFTEAGLFAPVTTKVGFWGIGN